MNLENCINCDRQLENGLCPDCNVDGLPLADEKEVWSYKNIGVRLPVFRIHNQKDVEITRIFQLVTYSEGHAEGYAKKICELFNRQSLVNELSEAFSYCFEKYEQDWCGVENEKIAEFNNLQVKLKTELK